MSFLSNVRLSATSNNIHTSNTIIFAKNKRSTHNSQTKTNNDGLKRILKEKDHELQLCIGKMVEKEK